MKEANTSSQSLSVALLMEDLKEAQQLSQIFRKTGVIPYVYNNLRDFWAGILDDIPSLTIVDVKLMSDKELLLINHPLVREDRVPLAFFYEEENRPLLFSTYELFHYGLICSDGPYQPQVKNILKRLNYFMDMEDSLNHYKGESLGTAQKIESLISNNQKLKEKSYYHKLFKSFSYRLEKQKHREDFYHAVGTVLEHAKEVENFAFLELSTNGQKLISPEMSYSGYRHIPSLWLGRSVKGGIEGFAQNLASQVALELLGDSLMSINIYGTNEEPDRLLFIKSQDEDFLNRFDWESFERILSGLYLHYENKASRVDKGVSKDIWMPWELMNLLDAQVYGKSINEPTEFHPMQDKYKLVDIDFSNVIDLVRSEQAGKFDWKRFYREFFNRLHNQLKIDFKLIPMGVEHVGLLVSKEEVDAFLVGIKAFILRYPYWRYLDNTEAILAREMKPHARMVPLSSRAYIDYIEGALQKTESKGDEFSSTEMESFSQTEL